MPTIGQTIPTNEVKVSKFVRLVNNIAFHARIECSPCETQRSAVGQKRTEYSEYRILIFNVTGFRSVSKSYPKITIACPISGPMRKNPWRFRFIRFWTRGNEFATSHCKIITFPSRSPQLCRNSKIVNYYYAKRSNTRTCIYIYTYA